MRNYSLFDDEDDITVETGDSGESDADRKHANVTGRHTGDAGADDRETVERIIRQYRDHIAAGSIAGTDAVTDSGDSALSVGEAPKAGDSGLITVDDPDGEEGVSDEATDGGYDSANEAPDDSENSADEVTDKTRMELYDWLQCVVSAIICGIFIFVFVGRTIGVEGDSMRGTLHWYDTVIMSNLFYTPKNGDIIIFKPLSKDFGDTPLVKRVIAVAGQTIDIDFDTGQVFVDGVVIDEPYINEPTTRRLNFSGPVTVGEGEVFVMGDNRNNSSDSRDRRVGMVDTRLILGKVLFLAVPGKEGPVGEETRDWSRFGFIY